MVEIKAGQVKELRDKSGVSMMECKKALEASCGDLAKAELILREKGLAAANKKATRATNQGLIDSYIHLGSKIGVLLEVNCETDFVARNQDFQNLAKDLCMQVAAANPLYVSPEDVAADVLEREKEIYREQLKESGKPANVIEKIVEGKLQKFYSEVCLLEQEFIKDNKVIIKFYQLWTNNFFYRIVIFSLPTIFIDF